MHLVVGVTKWHCRHETWHSHELLLLHILSSRITSSSTWHHSWHLWSHHWERHWISTKLWSTGDRSSCGGSISSWSTICVHHLLLHCHLLSKHGLVLLVHLLMDSHLLIDHLLLVKHHLLLSVWSSSILVGGSGHWSHWHHSWHHASEVGLLLGGLSGSGILSSLQFFSISFFFLKFLFFFLLFLLFLLISFNLGCCCFLLSNLLESISLFFLLLLLFKSLLFFSLELIDDCLSQEF